MWPLNDLQITQACVRVSVHAPAVCASAIFLSIFVSLLCFSVFPATTLAFVPRDLLSAVLFYVYDSAQSFAFLFFFFLQGGDSEHSMLEVKNISSFHRRVPHFNQAFCSLRAADGATSSTSTEHLFLSCELKAREPSGHQHCSVYFAI